MTRECVAALRALPEIRIHRNRFGAIERIDAQDTHFGGENLALLNGLYEPGRPGAFPAHAITNDDLCALEDLSNLRWLYLDRTSVNDEGLLSLRHLVNLEVLVLSQSDVRGPGLVHLDRLRRLRVLNLSDCHLDDEALRHLRGLKQVQTLALENAPLRGMAWPISVRWSVERAQLERLLSAPGDAPPPPGREDLRIIRAREAEIPQADRDTPHGRQSPVGDFQLTHGQPLRRPCAALPPALRGG